MNKHYTSIENGGNARKKMMNAKNWELGARPKCRACGSELDPETDAHHDGYRGSPHAHGGRGSFGLGLHHYVFGRLCEFCSETRMAPLQDILEYDAEWEWLRCGHKHVTPYDQFARVRPGNRRRCEKCRENQELDFEPTPEMLHDCDARRESRKQQTLVTKELQHACVLWVCDKVYSNDEP